MRWGVVVAVGAGAWMGVQALFGAGPTVHDLQGQYRFSCAQCHGQDGLAKAPDGSPLPGRVLADRRWLETQKDEDLVAVILDGKGAMPAFRFQMGADRARRLVTGVIRPMGRKVR